MFTGIIKAKGIVVKAGRDFSVKPEVKIQISSGESVSINGVCLTLLDKSKSWLNFELMKPTLEKTNLGFLKIGDAVNIEPALLLGDPLGGHFVSGHVDCVGVAREVKNQRYLTIKIPSAIRKYIVPQGSVAVNGVSLTVVAVAKQSFSVALVEYTLQHTNLINLKKGGKVNIEVDLLAKYLEKYVRNNNRAI